MTFLISPGSLVPGKSCQQRCPSHALRTEPPARHIMAGEDRLCRALPPLPLSPGGEHPTGLAATSRHDPLQGMKITSPCASPGDMGPLPHPVTTPKQSQPHCKRGECSCGGAGDPSCVGVGWRSLCGRSCVGTGAGLWGGGT